MVEKLPHLMDELYGSGKARPVTNSNTQMLKEANFILQKLESIHDQPRQPRHNPTFPTEESVNRVKSHEPATQYSRESSDMGYPRRFQTQGAHTPDMANGYKPVRQHITPPPMMSSRTPELHKVKNILANKRDGHMKIDD